MSGTAISFEPKGYRDVYWCHVLNEPVIVEYRKVDGAEVAHCNNCDSSMYPEMHTFMAHLHKPAK